jgi:2-polyprenyl-6-methoxyphenol hydroxylase-like FAD-dependent oxidoreductase
MWRGVTKMKPVLSGATFVRAGWLTPGKLVMYPIRNDIDGNGTQLMNWIAENAGPQRVARDWTRRGYLEDFIAPYLDWHWDWIDVPQMFRAAEAILEYPMVDAEPLPRWTFGRVTLLGDAAHPMVPRGSNGAGQAIVDAGVLTACLRADRDWAAALSAYERRRLPATTQVVLTNRTNPPDAILRLVYERTGDRPFASIDDVVSRAELVAITDAYKQVAGYDRATLART